MIECLLIEDVSVLLLLSASGSAAAARCAGSVDASGPELGAALPVMSSVLNALTSIVVRALFLSF